MDLQNYLNSRYTKDELTNLKALVLTDYDITDISALANLTNLTELHLSYNTITDISALANLTNLTNLYLSDNNITDISALANLTNLTDMHLNDNNIDNIDNLVFTNPATSRVVLRMSDGRLSCGCCCNQTEFAFKQICVDRKFDAIIEFFNL
jgi:Leucine-rich repeat (LRR) protein